MRNIFTTVLTSSSSGNRVLVMLCCAILMLTLIACGNSEQKPVNNNSDDKTTIEPPKNKIDVNSITINFTEGETTYIEELKQKGEFVIAIRKHPKMPYDIEIENRIYSIFHYRLVKSFADYLDVDLKIRLTSFEEYFIIDGTIPENIYDTGFGDTRYTPDLFGTVDLYADAFTILDWNNDFMDFVKIFPVRHFIVTRDRKTISSIEGLKDKTIAIEPLTYAVSYFNHIQNKLGLKLSYIYKDSTIDLLESVSVDWDSQAILLDSATAIRFVSTVYTNLNSCFPDENFHYVGWGIDRDNDTLKSILDKFIIYAHKTGTFDKLWREVYNYSFTEYLEMIDM